MEAIIKYYNSLDLKEETRCRAKTILSRVIIKLNNYNKNMPANIINTECFWLLAMGCLSISCKFYGDKLKIINGYLYEIFILKLINYDILQNSLYFF